MGRDQLYGFAANRAESCSAAARASGRSPMLALFWSLIPIVVWAETCADRRVRLRTLLQARCRPNPIPLSPPISPPSLRCTSWPRHLHCRTGSRLGSTAAASAALLHGRRCLGGTWRRHSHGHGHGHGHARPCARSLVQQVGSGCLREPTAKAAVAVTAEAAAAAPAAAPPSPYFCWVCVQETRAPPARRATRILGVFIIF